MSKSPISKREARILARSIRRRYPTKPLTWEQIRDLLGVDFDLDCFQLDMLTDWVAAALKPEARDPHLLEIARGRDVPDEALQDLIDAGKVKLLDC